MFYHRNFLGFLFIGETCNVEEFSTNLSLFIIMEQSLTTISWEEISWEEIGNGPKKILHSPKNQHCAMKKKIRVPSCTIQFELSLLCVRHAITVGRIESSAHDCVCAYAAWSRVKFLSSLTYRETNDKHLPRNFSNFTSPMLAWLEAKWNFYLVWRWTTFCLRKLCLHLARKFPNFTTFGKYKGKHNEEMLDKFTSEVTPNTMRKCYKFHQFQQV